MHACMGCCGPVIVLSDLGLVISDLEFVCLQQVVYSPSVDVRPEWNMVEQIAFASFSKLHFPVGEPEELAFCGQLQYYEKLFDRVTPKATRPLQRTQRVFRSVTTSDDPVVRCCTCHAAGLWHVATHACAACRQD